MTYLYMFNLTRKISLYSNYESFLFMIGGLLSFPGFGLILQINSLASELVV